MKIDTGEYFLSLTVMELILKEGILFYNCIDTHIVAVDSVYHCHAILNYLRTFCLRKTCRFSIR